VQPGGQELVPGYILNLWYVMTLTVNIPPVVSNDVQLHNTFSTSPRTVTADIEDCDYENPLNAGVASAAIVWTRDGIPQSDIPMSNSGGTVYQGTIPGQPPGTVVRYYIRATDVQALSSQRFAYSYRIARMDNHGTRRIRAERTFRRACGLRR
jgi:hypothetical protein